MSREHRGSPGELPAPCKNQLCFSCVERRRNNVHSTADYQRQTHKQDVNTRERNATQRDKEKQAADEKLLREQVASWRARKERKREIN